MQLPLYTRFLPQSVPPNLQVDFNQPLASLVHWSHIETKRLALDAGYMPCLLVHRYDACKQDFVQGTDALFRFKVLIANAIAFSRCNNENGEINST